mgnify:CR=1
MGNHGLCSGKTIGKFRFRVATNAIKKPMQLALRMMK